MYCSYSHLVNLQMVDLMTRLVRSYLISSFILVYVNEVVVVVVVVVPFDMSSSKHDRMMLYLAFRIGRPRKILRSILSLNAGSILSRIFDVVNTSILGRRRNESSDVSTELTTRTASPGSDDDDVLVAVIDSTSSIKTQTKQSSSVAISAI
jgi:hypothetical protein